MRASFSFITPALLALAAGLPVAASAQTESSPTPAASTTSEPTSAPAQAPAPAAASSQITIVSVIGTVNVRLAPGQKLQPATANMVLQEGSEVFTGQRSAAIIRVGSGQTFTIDRLGRVIVKEAINTPPAAAGNATDKTTLQIPYGRVQFDVSSTKVANDVKIEAPDATLAVKGTTGFFEVIPGGTPSVRAAGGELNTGIFNVMYSSKVVARVRKNFETNNLLPLVTDTYDNNTFVEIKDYRSRDQDSRQRSRWSAGGQRILTRDEIRRLIANGLPPIDNGDGIGGISTNRGLFTEVGQRIETVVSKGSIGFAVSGGGRPSSSFANNPTNPDFPNFVPRGLAAFYPAGQPTLLGLSEAPKPEGVSASIYALTRSGNWSLAGDILTPQSFINFTDLATLGPTIYAAGTPSYSGVYSLYSLARSGNNFTPTRVVSIPGVEVSNGSIAGANNRGTIFVTIPEIATNDLRGGPRQPIGPAFNILEVDPRRNFITAILDGSEDLATNFDALGPGASLEEIDLSNGVPDISAAGGSQIIVSGPSPNGQIQGTINLTPIPTIASVVRRPSSPTLGPSAGERNDPLAPPQGPQPPAPNARLTYAYDPLFFNMSYSTQASTRGILLDLIQEHVRTRAGQVDECSDSQAFTSITTANVQTFANQSGAIGSVILAFLNTLPVGHPCLPAGFIPTTGNPFPGEIVTSNANGLSLIRFAADGTSTSFGGDPVPPDPNGQTVGLGLARSFAGPGATAPTYYSFFGGLTSSFGGVSQPAPFASIATLSPGGSVFSAPVSVGLGDVLPRGLAALGDQLYTYVPGPENNYISRLDLDGNTWVGTSVMQFAPGILLTGEYGAANARGTIATTGRLSSARDNQTFFVEFDPRNNFIRSGGLGGVQGSSGGFAASAETVRVGTNIPTDLGTINFGGGTVVGNNLLAWGFANGRGVIVTFNLAATGNPGDPRVVRIESETPFVTTFFATLANGAASEGNVAVGPINGPSPVALSSDLTDYFSPLFLRTSYSAIAAGTGLVYEFLRDAVLAQATDQTQCEVSPALANTSLPTAIADNINLANGFNGALLDWFNSLGQSHPCLPSGFIPGGGGGGQVLPGDITFMLADGFGTINSAGQIINEENFTSTINGTVIGGSVGPVLGLSDTVFMLAFETPTAGIVVSTVYSAFPGASSWNAVGSYTTSAVNNNPLPVGLARINFDLFAPAYDAAGTGTSLVGQLSLDQANALVFTPRMSLPTVNLDPGAAGDSPHGSIWITGSHDDTLSGSRSGIVLQVDPVNNYIRLALGEAEGQIVVDPNTVVRGTTPPASGAITAIGSINVVGSTVVLAGGNENDDPVIMTINPSGVNGTANPVVSQIETGSTSTAIIVASTFASGSESGSLGSSGAPVPFTGTTLAGYDELFCRMSYSVQAASSGVVERLVRDHVLQRAVNAAACRNSPEFLATTGATSITQLVPANAQSSGGVNSVLSGFVTPLPGNHPCRPN